VVSSVATEADEVAIVNLTTLRPGHDPSCVVLAGEHSFVRHDSFVFYRGARMQPEAPLHRARDRGDLRQLEPISEAVLRRVQGGALASRFTPREVQEAVRRSLL
jgi:hypothetical protein